MYPDFLFPQMQQIGDWHPALPPSVIENGPADRIGCVRVYPLAGGHRETLVCIDDQHRRIAFTFADNAAGLPVRNYLSTMTVHPVTLGDCAYVEWRSRFDCDEQDEDKTTAQIRDGVLVPGLRALRERFGPSAQAPGPAT
jgi:polyketide cyclase/dehydrase/lipid transport protein